MFNFRQKTARKRDPKGPEARRSIRYRSGAPSELGWWDEDVFRTVDAAVVDVSQGGAAVEIEAATPPLGTIYLRLAEGPADGWATVEVRSVRKAGKARAIVHLQFAEGCSYAFFRSAVPGTALEGRARAEEPEEYDTRHWR